MAFKRVIYLSNMYTLGRKAINSGIHIPTICSKV